MIICPLCENQQAQGISCDVCGKAFSKDLVGEHGHSDPPVAPMEGLETTAQEALAAVRVPALAVDAPCVWCKHRQVTGTICDKCGMQRHRGARPAAPAEVEGAEVVTCRDCATPGEPGGRCVGCGAKMPSPEV